MAGLFKHAVSEAERLGLQITLNAGPGWTGSGGPWVKPEQSMQHIVASETRSQADNISMPFFRSRNRGRHFLALYRTNWRRRGATSTATWLCWRSHRPKASIVSLIWTTRPCMCERPIRRSPA